jgi:hypothetical protein
MVPHFVHIMSNGQIWISLDVAFNPVGTVVAQYRISSLPVNQLVCTLAGSPNASASALSVTHATVSGKQEGKEIH